MEFWFLIFAVFAFLLLYHFATRKYLNPYKLTMVFGKKGSGKTTLLTKIAYQYLKKGIPVFTTENIPGCYKIDPQLVGTVQIPPGSVVLIDEVGMIWDNRGFKTFSPAVRDWFKLQRHYKLRVFLFSQTFDVDKKIRDLVDDMYLVEKKFRVFSYAKRILRKTILVEPTAEAPAKLEETLRFDSILFFWCGSRRFTFIPKWSGLFDSFVTPELPVYEYEQIPSRALQLRRIRLPRIQVSRIFRVLCSMLQRRK